MRSGTTSEGTTSTEPVVLDSEPTSAASLGKVLDSLIAKPDHSSFRLLVASANLDPARDFIGASLRNIDMRDEDLRGFNFSYADLTGADFRRANVTGVSFSEATLTGVVGLPNVTDELETRHPEPRRQMNFYSAAQTYLASLSIKLPPNFDDALDALLRALHVAEREGEAKPELIAQGWRNFLNLDNQNREREKLEYISVLGAFTLLTAYSTPELEAAFSSNRQNLARSKLEMRLRLGSRLFMLGRKGKFGDKDAPDIIRLLAAAVQTLDEAGRDGNSLKQVSQQRMLGIRGVARLLLARSGSQIESDLAQAISDLEQSNRFGDQTVQNLVYRREAALRLYDVTKDRAVLEKLGGWLNEPGLKDRQFYVDLAQYHQMKALLSLHSPQGSAECLAAGIAACNAGLAIPAGPALDDLLLFSLRGFLYLLSSQQASFDDATRMQSLNSAIDDLRKSAKRNLGGASLSQALLRRAGRTKSTSPASAEADLTDALEATRLIHDAQARASIRRQIEASLQDCDVRRSLTGSDKARVLTSVRRLLAFGDDARRYTLTLLRAAHSLLKAADESPFPVEFRGQAESIFTFAKAVDSTSGSAQAQAIKRHLADLSRKLDGPVASSQTLQLYRNAIDSSGTLTTEFYSIAGDVALQYGKLISAAGAPDQATLVFEDAVHWFELALNVFALDPRIVSESFSLAVAHSRLGEAYLRLRDGALGRDHANNAAIEHLTEARRLGNETPHLLGLLGDAYYRRGYTQNSRADLLHAVELKQNAQSLGHSSRESWSILARIYSRLFDLDGASATLAKAFECALQAQSHSPNWPWPLFQLAELAGTPSQSREAAVQMLTFSVGEPRLVAMLKGGQKDELRALGAELAAANTEFGTSLLGGKSGVFVLEDPHRLLRSTIVLKPTSSQRTAVEIETTNSFRQYINSILPDRLFGLPTPIAMIEKKDGTATYVMERANAVSLGVIMLGEQGGGYLGATSALIATLEFLGVFHRWAGVRLHDPRSGQSPVRDSRRWFRKLGLSAPEIDVASKLIRDLLPDGLPAVRKRDAHPENWMVTGEGGIVMVDLEATSYCPALLDVVQLIDDYPVFLANDEGWDQRVAAAQRYWTQVFEIGLSRDSIERVYAGLAIYRCAFGIVFCGQERSSALASFSAKALDLRVRHFLSLLTFLTNSPLSESVRELSRLVLSYAAAYQPSTDVGLPVSKTTADIK